MFSIILVIFSTTETENDSFLPPKAFFTLSFISFTDTITKWQEENAYNSPVSIYTPTKGVTCKAYTQSCDRFVSIHTPTKGVTRYCFRFVCWLGCFNPHTHEGCDFSCLSVISSATCFNPHTHEGCDQNILI